MAVIRETAAKELGLNFKNDASRTMKRHRYRVASRIVFAYFFSFSCLSSPKIRRYRSRKPIIVGYIKLNYRHFIIFSSRSINFCFQSGFFCLNLIMSISRSNEGHGVSLSLAAIKTLIAPRDTRTGAGLFSFARLERYRSAMKIERYKVSSL